MIGYTTFSEVKKDSNIKNTTHMYKWTYIDKNIQDTQDIHVYIDSMLKIYNKS